MTFSITSIISQLQNKDDLSNAQAYDTLIHIFSGDCQLEDIKSILLLLAEKGESVSEIVGFTKALREKALSVSLSKPAFDTCGTGGTNKDRFNVSTAIAFLLAATDTPVAKHGNRGSKKPNGSFDFLESLGINFMLNPDQLSTIFDKTNLCFLFARNHHLAMKHVVQARKELARRTIFNLIGPLSNPAGVPYQIIGTTNESTAQKIAQTIQQLGTKKSLVIVGGDGLDELSIASPSQIIEITEKSITTSTFTPSELGIKNEAQDMAGGLANDNATLFQNLCQNQELAHPITKLICLNAGAAFYCYGKESSIEKGYQLALKAFKDNLVWKKVQEYKKLSNNLA